jgi:hypothetical protein
MVYTTQRDAKRPTGHFLWLSETCDEAIVGDTNTMCDIPVAHTSTFSDTAEDPHLSTVPCVFKAVRTKFHSQDVRVCHFRPELLSHM